MDKYNCVKNNKKGESYPTCASWYKEAFYCIEDCDICAGFLEL